jgi:hypothetical protein
MYRKYLFNLLGQQQFPFENKFVFSIFPFPPRVIHCKKKVCGFPVPSQDVTLEYSTKNSLAGNNLIKFNLIIPGRGEFGK